MALNFATLAKLAKGGTSLEDMAGILQAAGIDLKVSTLDSGPAVRAEFVKLAGEVTGGKVIAIQGAMKSGERIHALLVVHT